MGGPKYPDIHGSYSYGSPDAGAADKCFGLGDAVWFLEQDGSKQLATVLEVHKTSTPAAAATAGSAMFQIRVHSLGTERFAAASSLEAVQAVLKGGEISCASGTYELAQLVGKELIIFKAKTRTWVLSKVEEIVDAGAGLVQVVHLDKDDKATISLLSSTWELAGSYTGLRCRVMWPRRGLDGWRKGIVVEKSGDGLTRVRYDDDGTFQCHDLAHEEFDILDGEMFFTRHFVGSEVLVSMQCIPRLDSSKVQVMEGTKPRVQGRVVAYGDTGRHAVRYGSLLSSHDFGMLIEGWEGEWLRIDPATGKPRHASL